MPVRFYDPTGRLRQDPRVVRFAVEFGLKAAPFFVQHNWTWGKTPHIPSAEEITEALLASMDMLDAQPAAATRTSSGRICVERLNGRWTVTLEALDAAIALPEYKPSSDPVLHILGRC